MLHLACLQNPALSHLQFTSLAPAMECQVIMADCISELACSSAPLSHMACYRYIILWRNASGPLRRLLLTVGDDLIYNAKFKSWHKALIYARILLPPEEEPLEIFIRKVVSFDDGFDDEMFHATVLQLLV